MYSRFASLSSALDLLANSREKGKILLNILLLCIVVTFGVKDCGSRMGGRQTFRHVHLYRLNFVPCAPITLLSEKLSIFKKEEELAYVH